MFQCLHQLHQYPHQCLRHPSASHLVHPSYGQVHQSSLHPIQRPVPDTPPQPASLQSDQNLPCKSLFPKVFRKITWNSSVSSKTYYLHNSLRRLEACAQIRSHIIHLRKRSQIESRKHTRISSAQTQQGKKKGDSPVFSPVLGSGPTSDILSRNRSGL